MSYPIHITNIYELLNEDGEPQSARVNLGGEQKSTQPTRGAQTSGRGNSQGGSRPQGARDGQRRTGENRPPRQDRENRAPRSIDGARSTDAPVGGDFSTAQAPRRERTERRGGDVHRSSERRARNADQVGEFEGRRVYDRRSGTGRGREQKKGGAGRGNWGKEGEGENPQGENWDTTEENKEAPKEGEKVEETVVVEKDPAQEEEERLAREEQEKEDALMTLEAYLKQKEASAVKIELPQARKANEGVDQKELSKWGSYQQLKKDDDDENLSSKREETEKKNKNTVPLDQVFNVRDVPRPRTDDRPFRGRGGERGSRGGSRGGRGGDRDRDGSRGGDRDRDGSRGGNRDDSRGGNRGGRGGNRGGRGGSRGGESAPNFDLNSFPTLAPKA